MASSDNVASVDAWMMVRRPDAWISEAYARDTEVLTKALQITLSQQNSYTSETPISDSLNHNNSNSFLNFSGSDLEAAPAKRAVPGVSGKPGKRRKSRASKKKSQTTFIAADPANFRQMVQQVTGVRLGNLQVPLVKPEPQRPGAQLHGPAGCMLPTLDTSAYLLGHHPQKEMGVVTPSCNGPDSITVPETVVAAYGPQSGFDFEAFSCFPTLESWKVM